MDKVQPSEEGPEAVADPGNFSLYLLLLIQNSFPFVENHLRVDPYATFRPEVTHFFTFRIGKLLNECFIDMYRDMQSVSIATMEGQNIAEWYKNIRQLLILYFIGFFKTPIVFLLSGRKVGLLAN